MANRRRPQINRSNVLLILLLLMSGCATVRTRVDWDPDSPWIYPATQMELARLQAPAGSADQCFEACLIDLPFTLVFDTILMPIDLAHRLIMAMVDPMCAIAPADENEPEFVLPGEQVPDLVIIEQDL